MSTFDSDSLLGISSAGTFTHPSADRNSVLQNFSRAKTVSHSHSRHRSHKQGHHTRHNSHGHNHSHHHAVHGQAHQPVAQGEQSHDVDLLNLISSSPVGVDTSSTTSYSGSDAAYQAAMAQLQAGHDSYMFLSGLQSQSYGTNMAMINTMGGGYSDYNALTGTWTLYGG
ncbi:MAG TPA: hypothetical protein V6C78_18875 [Crinalium sp.]|jgi:hypothetical protein